jgi:hypothetical protein
MAKEKKQFKVKKHKHHATVGRLGGGYAVGGIPWFQLYYGGYWGGTAPGNDNSPNETAQNGFGQESGDGASNVSGSGGASASDGGGSGAM